MWDDDDDDDEIRERTEVRIGQNSNNFNVYTWHRPIMKITKHARAHIRLCMHRYATYAADNHLVEPNLNIGQSLQNFRGTKRLEKTIAVARCDSAGDNVSAAMTLAKKEEQSLTTMKLK